MAIFALLAKLSAKVVVTSHGRVYRNVSTVPRLLRFASRFAALCYLWWPHVRIAVSKTLANRYDRRRTQYIPVSIGAAVEDGHNNGFNEFPFRWKGYILFVGRLIPTKKVDLLINAYKRLKTRKQLLIVGDAPYGDDRYSKGLKKRASDTIRFLGFQYGDSLKNLYKNCSFFVLPSENEGLPITLLEALSYGCSVLASDISANREILNGRFGVMFKSGSLSDLTMKMQCLIDNPRLGIGSSGGRVEYIKAHYNWESVINSHEELYKSLVRA